MKLLTVTAMLFAAFTTGLFSAEKAEAVHKKAGVIVLKEDVTEVTERYISRALRVCADKGYDLLVIEMDTPGGLLMVTKDIVQTLLNSKIDTAVYVTPSGAWAGSAGVFITMAARYAYMAPGCNIGAAHPVNIYESMNPDSDSARHMAKKAENITIAWVESIASLRNRNVKWAIDSVSNSVAITSEKAVLNRVIDGIAATRAEMLEKIYGAGTVVKTEEIHRNWGEQIQSMPSNFAGIILIVLALILFFLELFVPSFGTLTIGGVISIILGSALLFNADLPFYQVMLGMIAGVVIAIVGLSLGLVFLVRNNLKLKVVSGKEGMIGKKGTAFRDFDGKKGKIQVHGEIWNAVLDESAEIKQGDELEVTKIEGLLLRVKKAAP